jgi:predicted porin
MKKSLFAIAAVTAFAGAAQAQSSVTVYGILDVGFQGTSARVPTISTQNVAGAVTTVQAHKLQANQFGQSAETSSRLGFRGTEDLGGGMSAFFTAEFGLSPQDQNLSGNAATGLFNRQTFVGLSKKGIGQAAIGTQYTPYFTALGMTDPGQTNNAIGSVIYPVGNAANAGISSSAMTIRSNNALTVRSDSFAGFRVGGMYAVNNADRTQSTSLTTSASNGGNTNINGWGVNADYTWKKLLVVAAYQSFKNETANGTNVTADANLSNLPSAPTIGSNGTVTVNGMNLTDNQTYAAATYDFGMLKAFVNWGNRKATSSYDSNIYLKRSAQQLGVRSFITPKIEGWASVGNGRYTAFGTGEPTANFTGYQLGSNYYLSKRTNLYAIFGSIQSSNVVSSNATGVSGSGGANMYAIGARHTF